MMMKKFGLLMLVCVVTFILARAANASLINPGFESGTLDGWIVNIAPDGDAQVVTRHVAYTPGVHDYSIYSPVEGNYFAKLEPGIPDQYTKIISQSIPLSVGDTLSGWAAFHYGDYVPYNDNAYVKIYEGTNLIATPWQESGNGHPDYWRGPWTQWSFTATNASTYTLEFAVTNYGDPGYDSFALFDAVDVQGSTVPLPGTLLLFCSGLLGIIGIKRNFNA
jgi:hypothetical protein